MKKRIFISVYFMEIGGIERSLLGLLNSLDYDRYDVDLFIHRHTGEFLPMIPKAVNLLPEDKNYATFARPIKDLLSEGYLLIGLARIIARVKTVLYNKKNKLRENGSAYLYMTKMTSRFLPSLHKYGCYDLAISFVMPHNIVLDKVNAKTKIGWIHTDYSSVHLDVNEELPVWAGLDYIATISDSVTESFLKLFPSLKNKITLIENILSPDFVWEQALMEKVSDEMPDEENTVKLCSVGRFSEAKNFDNAVLICKHLTEYGIKFKWYVIGYGGMEALIRQQIKASGMEQHFILLGKKTNPYPYIKACDIYVQPSRYEGKAVTVREAQILRKPVVITSFPTAASQLTNGFDGLIVPMDNEGAAQGIAALIKDSAKQQQLIKNMQQTDYGNSDEVEKIYKLIS